MNQTSDDGQPLRSLHTDGREALQVLRESEARFRTLAERAFDLIVTLDAEGVVHYANSAVGRLLGHPPEALVGTNVLDLIHPDDSERVSGVVAAELARRGPVGSIECRVRTAGGSYRVMEITGGAVELESGAPGIVAHARDVTARKRADQVLEAIHHGTARATGEEFFRELVRCLGELLGVRHAFVGRLLSEDAVRTVAVWAAGDFAENFDYCLEGTPCEQVTRQRTRLYADRVQARFPRDRLLAEMGVESYLGTPLRDAAGNTNGLLVVMDDQPLTDTALSERVLEVFGARAGAELGRRAVEEALRTSEARHRAIVRGLPDSVFVIAKDGTVLDYAAPRDDLLAVSAEEFVGKRVVDVLPPGVAKDLMDCVTRAVGSRETQALVYQLPDQLDAVRDFETRIAPGAPGEVVAVARDVTEHRRAEEALRRSQANLSALIENTDGSIWSVDRGCRLIVGNSIFHDYIRSGRGRSFEPGETVLSDDISADLVGEWRGYYERALGGERFSVETQRRVGKNPGYMHYRFSPLVADDGSVSGVTVFGRDVTQSKRAEEALRRYTDELAQANEEIKRFAHAVSHDLRGPLINLEGFSGLLRGELEALRAELAEVLVRVPEKQRERCRQALDERMPGALHFIEAAVEQMSKHVDAMLQLSRLGRRELAPERLDMDALVQATLDAAAHELAEHRAEVSISPLPAAHADPVSMEMVWTNLVRNAVQYLDPDRPAKLQITGETTERETVYHLRDNGRGIPQRLHDRVFAPFRRAGHEDVPGEGMGLAYVQALLHRHGGRIWFKSEEGSGTTFSFSVPRAAELPEQSREPPS